MSRLLFIQSSPRHAQSKSTQIAQAYLSALSKSNPDLSVDVLSVWETELPVFDGDKVAAKINVMQGKEHSESEKTAWDQIVGIANRFISADRYLLAVPMWNGGIPYPLKHYIDVIHQPGLLWGLKPGHGLLRFAQGQACHPCSYGRCLFPFCAFPSLRHGSPLLLSARLAQPGGRDSHRRSALRANAAHRRSGRRLPSVQKVRP